MPKGVEYPRTKRERASAVIPAKKQRGAAELFPAKQIAGRAPGPKRAPMPEVIAPCLATLVERAPSGERWLHEIKWDGYRLMAHLNRGRVVLRTRNGHDWTARFPSITRAVAGLPVNSAILDGEAVVHDERGGSSFSLLQAALGAREGPGHKAAHEAVLYAFDVLYLDGRDLRERPLEERRRSLAEVLSGTDGNGHVRLSEVIEGDGPMVWRHACQLGLEGIISKRPDCPYRSGRTGHWLKTKCVHRQELVICGYLPLEGRKASVGALVLGYYQEGELIHAGRAGTGFTAETARELWESLQSLRTDRPPFAGGRPPGRSKGAEWVAPELVAEVEHRGWTSDGLLRHAAYKGLRDDKEPDEVRRQDR